MIDRLIDRLINQINYLLSHLIVGALQLEALGAQVARLKNISSIYQSINLSICLSIYLSIYLSVYPSIYLSIYLSNLALRRVELGVEVVVLLLPLGAGRLEARLLLLEVRRDAERALNLHLKVIGHARSFSRSQCHSWSLGAHLEFTICTYRS